MSSSNLANDNIEAQVHSKLDYGIRNIEFRTPPPRERTRVDQSITSFPSFATQSNTMFTQSCSARVVIIVVWYERDNSFLFLNIFKCYNQVTDHNPS